MLYCRLQDATDDRGREIGQSRGDRPHIRGEHDVGNRQSEQFAATQRTDRRCRDLRIVMTGSGG